MVSLERYPLSEKHPLGRPLSEGEVLAYLQKHEELRKEYSGLSVERKDEFLKFCTGAKGLKICYDPVFKFIMDPDKHPERLSEFLSVVLKQKVSVKQVLPREGERLYEESSLVVMDVVVELEDGSLGNVEIQKVGYAFPGPRAACYSSDLVLRQYSRIRDRRKRKFSYRELKTVYTIVIMEESTRAMRDVGENGSYIHYAKQQFDTGIKMDLLQQYVFICLDSYKEMLHNKDIKTPLEAWLGFLAFDDPERIWQIQSRFKQFRPMYEELADFRNNTEEVLSMFSKELAIMDRNTVKYMMDEDKAEIKRLKKEKDEALRESKKVREKALKEVKEAQEQAKREAREAQEQAKREAREAQEANKRLLEVKEQTEKKIKEQEAIIEQLRQQINREDQAY